MSSASHSARSRPRARRSSDGLFLAIFALGFALRFVDLTALPLIPDEAYYWLWSEHLDWAYTDHPAGMALLIRAGTALLGDSELGIRWVNALLGAICVALIYRIGCRLFSRAAGRFAAALTACGAPYLITSRFTYTNAAFLSLMLLNLILFFEMVRASHRRSGWAISFGVTLALLFNVKFTAYLYAMALGVLILAGYRSLLRDPRFWSAVGIAGLGLVPILIWNAAHDWTTFRWQAQHFVSLSPGDPGTQPAQAVGLLRQWWRNARHAWFYLTWPVVLGALGGGAAAFAGSGLRHGLRRFLPQAEAARMLVLSAALILPVLLSPSNSPRNLASGMVFLFLLLGDRMGRFAGRARVAGNLVLIGVASLGLLYGYGTAAGVQGLAHPFVSNAVPRLQRDALGWQAFADALDRHPDVPVHTIDYTLAGQLHFYTGREVVTSWYQYRLWGIPDLDPALILAQDYLSPDCVTGHLGEMFRVVTSPEIYRDARFDARVYLWRVEALQVDPETLLDRLDFLTLWEDCR
ncbi:MAG: glycosyltransferase family 39 protein [Anaerolineae bacterium]|nr:glycosyltransferase family 39 protein [Anaerolineae bacterium]